MILRVATLAIPLLLTRIALSSTLVDRKATDPYIVCRNAFVPRHREVLPPGYDRSTYLNTMDLCSLANGAPKNVGCWCSSSTSQIDCDENLADPQLWSATFWRRPNRRPLTFPRFCAEVCSCTLSNSTAATLLTDVANHASSGAAAAAAAATPPATLIGYFPIDGSDNLVHVPLENVDAGQVSRPQGGQCGTSCKSAADCKVKGADAGCTCVTQSEQYQPGAGKMAFLAACIMPLSGKRQEARPCPCNGTYVSRGCCGAKDGLVWEGTDKKLGEMLDEG